MKRNILVGARFLFAALTFAAVITQLVISAQHGADLGNFFSYITILSNIFAAVVLAVSGYRVLVGRRPTEADDVVRGSATIAMAVVGIVFGLLLSG